MKILFVWTGFASCIADCWRVLAKQPNIRLKVCVVLDSKLAHATGYRKEDVLRDLEYVVVDDVPLQKEIVKNFCGSEEPDVIFVVGWHSKVCRGIVEDSDWKEIPKICMFDMPWRWNLRCFVAPLILGSFLRKYTAAYVPGKICECYARYLGFRKIFKGLLAIDTKRFACKEHKPRRDCFLYVGRYSPEKRLDVLFSAYRLYRMRGGKLPLRCYGKGNLEKGFEDIEGLSISDFVPPATVPSLYHHAKALVLASDSDNWPLVLLEAMSAGCRIIASDRCMNRPELGASWRVFPHGDPDALARELLAMEKQADDVEIPEVVETYDCRTWALRTIDLATVVLSESAKKQASISRAARLLLAAAVW